MYLNLFPGKFNFLKSLNPTVKIFFLIQKNFFAYIKILKYASDTKSFKTQFTLLYI